MKILILFTLFLTGCETVGVCDKNECWHEVITPWYESPFTANDDLKNPSKEQLEEYLLITPYLILVKE